MKINYPAVIVAAVIHWISGGVWYGIFGSTFAGFIGGQKMAELERQSEAKALILAFVSSLILAYVLARVLHVTRAKRVGEGLKGLKIVFLLWLGFIAATQLLTVLFEGRNLGLYLLNVGYQLVACALAATILLIWKPRQTFEAMESAQAQVSAGV